MESKEPASNQQNQVSQLKQPSQSITSSGQELITSMKNRQLQISQIIDKIQQEWSQVKLQLQAFEQSYRFINIEQVLKIVHQTLRKLQELVSEDQSVKQKIIKFRSISQIMNSIKIFIKEWEDFEPLLSYYEIRYQFFGNNESFLFVFSIWNRLVRQILDGNTMDQICSQKQILITFQKALQKLQISMNIFISDCFKINPMIQYKSIETLKDQMRKYLIQIEKAKRRIQLNNKRTLFNLIIRLKPPVIVKQMMINCSILFLDELRQQDPNINFQLGLGHNFSEDKWKDEMYLFAIKYIFSSMHYRVRNFDVDSVSPSTVLLIKKNMLSRIDIDKNSAYRCSRACGDLYDLMQNVCMYQQAKFRRDQLVNKIRKDEKR